MEPTVPDDSRPSMSEDERTKVLAELQSDTVALAKAGISDPLITQLNGYLTLPIDPDFAHFQIKRTAVEEGSPNSTGRFEIYIFTYFPLGPGLSYANIAQHVHADGRIGSTDLRLTPEQRLVVERIADTKPMTFTSGKEMRALNSTLPPQTRG